MKISCGNCKANRTFSGEPLRCEVCGCECATALEKVEENSDEPLAQKTEQKVEQKIGLWRLLRVAVWAVLMVGAGYLLVQYLSPERHQDFLTPGKYQLALKYNLTEDQVLMDEKPKGCDFSDDPPGDKHCHFEQSLNVVRKCLTPNCPVERVYASWRRVKD